MVFVTNTKLDSRRTSAFGELNIPLNQLRKELVRALTKAHELSEFKRSENVDKLRKKLVEIMGLNVCFAPKLIRTFESSKWPKSRLPVRQNWSVSPVWRCAPTGAYIKANRFCSLLHTVVNGGVIAPISRLLERIAINIWRLSLKDFSGLCRKIVARIAKCNKVARRSLPDPLPRAGALSNNPILSDGADRSPVRINHSLYDYGMRVKHAPSNLGVLAILLNKTACAVDLKRVRLLRRTWFAPLGVGPVRVL